MAMTPNPRGKTTRMGFKLGGTLFTLTLMICPKTGSHRLGVIWPQSALGSAERGGGVGWRVVRSPPNPRVDSPSLLPLGSATTGQGQGVTENPEPAQCPPPRGPAPEGPSLHPPSLQQGARQVPSGTTFATHPWKNPKSPMEGRKGRSPHP